MGHGVEDPEEKGKKVKCLSCGSPGEGFFCIDCHTVLPISDETDYFTALEMEKRPSVDLDKLKNNFLKMSEVVHPDKFYNASPQVRDLVLGCSSRLNKAYSTLKDPKERIKYLISLTTDKEAPVSNRASAETMEFFIDASDVCNDADSFLKGGGEESEREKLYERLQEFKEETQRRWNSVIQEIDVIDKEWVAASGGKKQQIRGLQTLSNELSYLAKLQSLLNEMIVALS